ncbi:hypothetical protein AB1Y20_011576 [Prymnesium parvum]|uniref:Uncharacterized protein n=1 Tax=Prymnesium parvum TaxID=97485 RepID=A0AB34IGW9_PRYPA
MTLSIECQLLESVEQRTRSGAQPFRTLTEHLGRAPLHRDAFVSRMVRFLPGASPAALSDLFSRHACDGLLLPETFARRVVSGFEVGGGLAPAPRAAWQEPPRHSPPPPAPPHERVDGVPRPREARGVADAAGADVDSRAARRAADGSDGSDGASPPSAGGGLDECARVGLLPALVQAREAVERRVAELGRRQGEPHGGLPAAERVTLHASRAHTAACQLAVLRLLRAAAPLSPTLTPAQLAAALAPLRRHAQAACPRHPPSLAPCICSPCAPHTPNPPHLPRFLPPFPLLARSRSYVPQGTAPSSECPPLLLIDRPALLHALTQLTGGRIEALVEQLAPSLPPPPSAPPPPYGPAAAALAERSEAVPTGETVFYGPFDRGSGRKGEQRRGVRRVDPPAVLPTMMKYRFCRTPLLLPAAFDPALITRSARRPSLALRRAFVHGYNGLGRHNRSPNVFESHDGRLVYSVASLGVVMDVSGKDGAPLHERQTCFDGHTDDVTCIAVHRTAERTLVATGQLASTSSHGVEHCPWLAVWDLSAAAPPRLLARVGWVPDDRPGAHDKARRPFYSRSVCAVVFSADGKQLFAIGSDDQSTLGVWAWQTPMFGSDPPGQMVKGQLLAHGPTFREAPLAISQRRGDAMPQPAVHQIVVAPQPLSGNESSTAPFNTDGAQLIAVVGASGLPKFGALSGDTRANSMGMQLAFKNGQLGKSARGALPKALSAVLFGGRHFAAPSGAAHGLTFIGSTDGRIFIFDAPRSLAALRALSAHQARRIGGAEEASHRAFCGLQGAITVLCSADDAIASGGSDGRVRLWRGQPAAPFLAQVITRPCASRVPLVQVEA